MAKKLTNPQETEFRKQNKLRKQYDTTQVETKDIGQAVEEMRLLAYSGRRVFERRWYDNNFFDDGFHFRYLSRTTNKIVDLSERATIYTPQRAIPKASRQIRGIANLLVSQDPTPTVYPDETQDSKYAQGGDLEKARQETREIAKRRGWWLEEEWEEPDESGETMLEKIALMPVLTAKHSISYLQIWCDPNSEKIRSQVYDAFDIYVLGNMTSIYDCPFIIKAVPQSIAQIKANPNFDAEQLLKISPDNRHASSEIKEAYMQTRYGRSTHSEHEATLILKEAFIKEYLNEENMVKIKLQENADTILKDREIGDVVIRQVFVAGNVWLRDEYLTLKEYPFVEFRMEPGPLYNVPLIERFINANKSLDSAVSRIERYFHTMVTGTWLKRKGEQFKLTNISGGQVLEYDATPPTQAQPSAIPGYAFEFISLLTNFIEEQGVSTTTLGKLPAGVKANAAIESLKESEYANLIIATRRMKETIRKIAVKMFELADENYIHPKTISHNERGKTEFFNVIGDSALSKRRKMKIDTQDNLVPLSAGVKVDIEIESGMAYTKEGQKATIQQLIETMLQWAQLGFVDQNAVKVLIQRYLEVYGFGATAEFMEAFESAQGPITDEHAASLKMAILQALQDAGEIGQEASQKRVMENKLGSLQALKDAGLVKHIQDAGQAANATPAKETVSINYKDAPEDVKRQMEAEAGFQPSQTISPSGTDQIAKHANVKQTQVQAERAHAVQVAQLAQQQQAQEAEQAQAEAQSQQTGGQNGSTE